MLNAGYANKDLHIELHLIGYKHNGESILIILRDRFNIFYRAVIDCYKYSNINLTLKTLKEMKIDKLDLICLTHAHEDHYKGLLEILNHYKVKNIDKLCVPIGHTPRELYSIIDKNEYASFKELFDFINKNRISLGEKYKVASQDFSLYERYFETPTSKGVFKIRAISPLPCFTEEDEENNIRKLIEKKKLNDAAVNTYSIGLEITFGKRKIYLLSDIENQTFNALKNTFLKEGQPIDFIKIPHHGSDSSDDCLSLFFERNKVSKINFAGVTSYKSKTELPCVNTLQKYQEKIGSIYCTTDYKNRNGQSHKYGILKLCFPFEAEENISLEQIGNTIKVS